MAYLDRYEWCMSSIPDSLLCPSNVDKSTQPWPLPVSTSLISNTNNEKIALNTDSISGTFFSKEENKVTQLYSTTFDPSYDYYTNKRIEQLHERMDDIQISSFLKFINYHLSSKNEQKLVKDLSQDLANGHVLIDLIEIFSSTKLKREHGRTRFHALTNVQYVLDYLKLHMQHINISPHDIVSGNRKQILALLWIIMKIFDFPSFRITTNKHIFHENTLFAFGQDRSIVLKWINHILNQILTINLIYIKDFHPQTWLETDYLSLIIKYLCPLSLKYGTLEYFEYIKQLDHVNSNDQERLNLCLKLSNYCFNTISTVDQSDRTEKSFFRFFSELHQNVLFILKSNQIGKLTKSNPYTKQLLETINMLENSEGINEEDECYLICTEDELREIEEPEQAVIETENIGELLPTPTEETHSTQSSSPNPPETLLSNNDDPLHHLRSCKPRRRRSTLERLSSISPAPPNDLFVKLINCLRDPKLPALKYILILACLCFSILIIFIHK